MVLKRGPRPPAYPLEMQTLWPYLRAPEPETLGSGSANGFNTPSRWCDTCSGFARPLRCLHLEGPCSLTAPSSLLCPSPLLGVPRGLPRLWGGRHVFSTPYNELPFGVWATIRSSSFTLYNKLSMQHSGSYIVWYFTNIDWLDKLFRA